MPYGELLGRLESLRRMGRDALLGDPQLEQPLALTRVLDEDDR